MDIDEVVKAALRKLKVDTSKIDPGSYRLDGTRLVIDLKGVLVKQEDEWHVPTTSVPTYESFALALQLMGIQADGFMEKLEVAMNMALSMDEKAKEYVAAFNKAHADTIAKFQASMKSLPPRRHAGKIVPKDVEIDLVVNPGPALVSSATVPAP